VQPLRKIDSFFEKKPKSVLQVSDDTESFIDGDKVRHRDFGEGIVVGQDDIVISIIFKKVGLKKLAKSIAPLEKI